MIKKKPDVAEGMQRKMVVIDVPLLLLHDGPLAPQIAIAKGVHFGHDAPLCEIFPDSRKKVHFCTVLHTQYIAIVPVLRKLKIQKQKD